MLPTLSHIPCINGECWRLLENDPQHLDEELGYPRVLAPPRTTEILCRKTSLTSALRFRQLEHH